MSIQPSKKKKLINCPCGAKDVELTRDDDGDWEGTCGECGRNLGRVATRAEVASDVDFLRTPATPAKKEKKSIWE